MIPVREISPGKFEQITGNPVLTSLDGEERAPLQTILHDSWSDADRERFGVFAVDPFIPDEGREAFGEPTYIKKDGTVREVRSCRPISKCTREKLTRIEALNELPEGAITITGLAYPVIITKDEIHIQCEAHSPGEWAAFTDDQIAAMGGITAARFWKQHRDMILRLAGNL